MHLQAVAMARDLKLRTLRQRARGPAVAVVDDPASLFVDFLAIFDDFSAPYFDFSLVFHYFH